MTKWTYQGDPGERNVGGLLPDGDYDYIVLSCGEPYESKAHNIVVSVELEIQGPHKIRVFYNPWTGTDSSGEKRDGIADFLHAIGRVPKVGEEPNWRRLEGARGRCRLTHETAKQGKYQGQELNKVHYLYRPKIVGETNTVTSYPESEVKQAQRETTRRAGGKADPDDIPWRTTIYRDIKQQRLSRRFVQ
jgi:hypothetical protein